MRLSIAVLAGGRSRRMGFDKAALRLRDGRTLLQRQFTLARSLGPVEILLSCRPDQNHKTPPGIIRVHDDGEAGPLGGIVSALSAMRGDALLALGVDLVRIDRFLLARIVAAAAFGCTAGVMTRTQRGIEPLASVYPREALDSARALLCTGRDLSLQTLARFLVEANLARWHDVPAWDEAGLTNVNRRMDLPSLIGFSQPATITRPMPDLDSRQFGCTVRG